MNWMRLGIGLLALLISGFAKASLIVPMYLTSEDGAHHKIGYVKADDTIYGLLLTPHLRGLTQGAHGFHVHAHPMCDHDGMAAGGHLDPEKEDAHRGPYMNGHLGDLPILYVDKRGQSTLPVLAPRLDLAHIKGKALMIHQGGDNYADTPEKLGGGGARIACGLIPYH